MMNQSFILIILISFFTTFSIFAKDRSCLKGDFYRQTKSLHLQKHRTNKTTFIRKKRKTKLFFKVVNTKGWSCRVEVWEKSRGKLKRSNKYPSTYQIDKYYFKKGTTIKNFETLSTLAKDINKIVSAPKSDCDADCKGREESEVENTPKKKPAPPKIVIQEKKSKSTSFSAYSNSDQVNKMINSLKEMCSEYCCYTSCVEKLPKKSWCKSRYKNSWNKKKKTKTCKTAKGRCYGYVKKGMMAGGLLDGYLKKHKTNYPWTRRAHAKYAGNDLLKRVGFKNLLKTKEHKKMTPYTAPKGAILVYDAPGGTSGHIEVKDIDENGKMAFYSDFKGSAPIPDNPNYPYLNNRNRKLIGIYILPEDKL